MVGETLDSKYRILGLLGEGGMGSVYEAERTTTGERVAVKLIRTDRIRMAAADVRPSEREAKAAAAIDREESTATGEPEPVAVKLVRAGHVRASDASVRRFEREAKAAAAIDTEHIARVLDAGTDPATGAPYMVLELLRGEDLHQLLGRVGVLSPEVALRVVGQACAGLASAHEARVVHRDIKPANLFLARRGDGEVVVKLLDFGISKIKPDTLSGDDSAGLTHTGALVGSPLYMSPEQARGIKGVSYPTDLWALGVVLYRALSGAAPHQRIEAFGELIAALCWQLPAPLQDVAPWVPPDVAAVVHRALRREPAERFASAAAMLDAIRALLPGGLSLQEEMLAPLDEAARVTVAPRLADAGLPSGYESTAAATMSTDGRTVAEPRPVAATKTPPRRSRALVAVGVALVAGVGVFGLQRALGRPASAVTAGAPPPNTVTTGAPPPDTVTTGAPPSNTVTTGAPPSNTVTTGAPPPNTGAVAAAPTVPRSVRKPSQAPSASARAAPARPTVTANPLEPDKFE